MNYNRIILAGNLTRDPQLAILPSNTPVCEFGMAINRKAKEREETCFVDCKLYGSQAETFSKHMAKGRPVLVEGRLSYRQWEDRDGGKRSKHEVVVDRFQFVGSKGEQQEKPEPARSDDDNPF